MSAWWHRIGLLALDDSGELWRRRRGDWRRLGPVDSAEVPARLEAARAELLDRWRDAFDESAEQDWSYRLSVWG